jgi:hypothetical protein
MILQRLAFNPQRRFDLPDLKSMEAYGQNDWSYFLKGFLSEDSYILSGFDLTNFSSLFTGLTIKIRQSQVALFHSEATTQAQGFYVSAGNEADASLALSANATNYIEIDLSVETGAPDERAFWDPANEVEYSSTADTVVNLVLNITSNSTGFTAGRLPLYKVVTGASAITSVQDCRNLLFRLGTGGTSPNASNSFTWPSLPSSPYQREEPSDTATSSSDPAPYQGADKNIKTFKQWMDAVMTSIKEVKGTDFWYGLAEGSLAGLFALINSSIAPSSTASTPKWSWDGTNLSVTDSDGTPASTDDIAHIRIMGSGSNLNLRRADGQASTSAIPLGADQVLFVKLPSAGAHRNYSGNGAADTNYQVCNRADYDHADNTYWIAYRNAGTTVTIRGGVKLESGESGNIDEGVLNDLLENIGVLGEDVPPDYTRAATIANANIRGVANEPIVNRVGKLTDAMGDAQEDRSAQLFSTAAVAWSGSALTFAADIVLRITNTKSGTANAYTIQTSNSPLALADGDFAYVSITRGTNGNVTPVLNSVTPIPAQTQANKDVYVLFHRIGSDLLIPLHKQLLVAGTTVKLGTAPGAAGSRAYPTVFLSPAGNGDVTTWAAALAAVPGAGGVILVMDDITVNSIITIPSNVKVMGRDRNATITFGASGGFLVSGERVVFDELKITGTSGAANPLVDVTGGTMTINKCQFVNPAGASLTCVRLNSDYNVVKNNEFFGVISPSTGTAIEMGFGFPNNDEESNKFSV